jgi:lipocalin
MGAGSCIEATYGLNPGQNNVSVFNEQILTKTGQPDSISGYAYVVDESEPGQLAVIFPSIPSAPVGEYWVYELGPVVDGLYDYAIVSDSKKLTLFVLTRDVNRFANKYDEQVLQSLEKLGFTTLVNKPLATDTDNCGW